MKMYPPDMMPTAFSSKLLSTTPYSTTTLAMEGENPKTLVLAIGNLLLSDEGTGIHVLHYLRSHHTINDVCWLDGGTLSFSIAGFIENSPELIVIDAAELHATPGTVKTFVGPAMDAQLGACKLSVHEVGLVDLMDMVRLSERLPARRALVGIQPLTMAQWDDKPSPAVAKAIPQAAQAVLDLIQEWHS
ncbi:hydrogenase maturation protease [Candidatus Venteria ishoeyi]|nr:hydrogenase maturation protease [Candidatus Venteria ishoeyi]